MVKKNTGKEKTNSKSLDVDFNDIKKASAVLRSLNHKMRQKIIFFIHERNECNVKDIYTTLKLEQSLTSLHLAILRKSKLVETKRVGQSIMYSVNYTTVSTIKKGAKILITK